MHLLYLRIIFSFLFRVKFSALWKMSFVIVKTSRWVKKFATIHVVHSIFDHETELIRFSLQSDHFKTGQDNRDSSLGDRDRLIEVNA